LRRSAVVTNNLSFSWIRCHILTIAKDITEPQAPTVHPFCSRKYQDAVVTSGHYFAVKRIIPHMTMVFEEVTVPKAPKAHLPFHVTKHPKITMMARDYLAMKGNLLHTDGCQKCHYARDQN